MELDIQSTITLNNGVEMPLLGLGTGIIPDGEPAHQAVTEALEAGYRLVDTSKDYGNEPSVGKAIRDHKEPTSEVFVTTKLESSDHGYQGALRGFKGSLERLGLRVIDLYLIHAPGEDRLLADTWRGMVENYNSGHCRAIGVSNFELRHIRDLLDLNTVIPTVNQIRLSPFNYRRQEELVGYCLSNGIQIMAYSPLNKGMRLNEPKLADIAHRHSKTPAQVMLRWGLQHSFIVIPRSRQHEHIRQNVDIFDFLLSEEEMSLLDSIT